MTINSIGHVDPIQPEKKPGRTGNVRESTGSDSINVSSEAVKKAELYQVVELIKAVPEMPPARIAELKQKINDPAYLNDRIINATADKIMESFGL
ncbi:MAG: flagellar biosynthesis anti-sigma factor FlgM [Treponema sp.]|jgi:negative regulator of flagellin synthesis FlgM|nr:flagellar biosynthesis anti-sigma factor FlgM [Treponema sp.]